jgi:hypothetical protein
MDEIMKPKVYFIDLRVRQEQNLFDKLELLLNTGGLKDLIGNQALVALKLHFGEQGNLSYIHPRLVRCVVDLVKACGGQPFLTDTNSLYVGTRSDAVRHLHTAHKNGFGLCMQDAPLIIADGLRGADAVKVEINQQHYKTVDLAMQICQADAMVCLTHFKAHELTGIGGAIKNVGMGLAARSGKLSIHSTVIPYVAKNCISCGTCIQYCPSGAISLSGPEGRATMNNELCIGCGQCLISCPEGHIHVRWDESVQNVQEKICEYAYGLLKVKKLPAIFINFITQVTPECDCYSHSDAAIVPDIGILASLDVVAIDQASADLVNRAPGLQGTALKGAYKPGGDKFRSLYPKIDWAIQLDYGEKIGLGTRGYELLKLKTESG